MTQTTASSASSFPLPDVFSVALIETFERAQPSIVQIRTAGHGAGTGVVWHPDGRIITNHHVVARDSASIQVLFSDGRTLEAKVVDRNPRLDLAILKVKGDNLQALPAGDSSQLRIGELVFAIGHPWGQRWVVTAGIVSAISSVKLADDLTTQYIKSDVRLAPGNSGGPLLNADGNIVGINAMIFGGDLSVAIPSHVVSKWLAGLPRYRVTLGIEIQTVALPDNARQLLKRESGVRVVGIRPDRKANNLNDLLIGDILLDVAGKPVKETASLLSVLAQSEERKSLSMTILRDDKIVTVDVATLIVER
jgi:serine protease Do